MNQHKASETTRILNLSFNLPIFPRQIPQWRGAFVEMAGWEDDLFHNHKSSKDYYYRYPKLQYRIRRRHAALFAVNEGVDALQKILASRDWTLRWQDEPFTLQINDLAIKEHHFTFLDTPKKYKLHRWLALNPENHRRYQTCNGMIERVHLLEKLLRNHLMAGIWGMGWNPQTQVKVSLENIHHEQLLSFHQTKTLAFDITFSCNVDLPSGMSIGKGVSLGFGWLHPIRLGETSLSNGRPNKDQEQAAAQEKATDVFKWVID